MTCVSLGGYNKECQKTVVKWIRGMVVLGISLSSMVLANADTEVLAISENASVVVNDSNTNVVIENLLPGIRDNLLVDDSVLMNDSGDDQADQNSFLPILQEGQSDDVVVMQSTDVVSNNISRGEVVYNQKTEDAIDSQQSNDIIDSQQTNNTIKSIEGTATIKFDSQDDSLSDSLEKMGLMIPSNGSIENLVTYLAESETNLFLPIETSLVIKKPEKTIRVVSNAMVSGSVYSYWIYDENNSMSSYCSQIVYSNIAFWTHQDVEVIGKGNAEDVWKRTENKIWTGMLDKLVRDSDVPGTIFDIVSYLGESYHVDPVRRFHRIAVFQDTQGEWYVVDPIRTSTREPVLLQDYEAQYRLENEIYKLVASYIPSVLDNGSLQSITVIRAEQIQSLVDQSLVHLYNNDMPVGEWNAFIDKISFDTAIDYESTDDSELVVSLSQETDLLLSTETLWSWSDFVLEKRYFSNVDFGFAFGMSGQDIVFSRPVRLRYKVDISDGSFVQVHIKHEGDTNFGVSGLSVDPQTTCVDGNPSIPGSLVVVSGGIVEFWTCRASLFSLSYTGSLSSGYVDNGIKDFPFVVQTGVHFATGETIKSVQATIHRELEGNTTCGELEKGFVLIHPDGTQVTLIQTGTMSETSTDPCPRMTSVFSDFSPTSVYGFNHTSNGYFKPVSVGGMGNFVGKNPAGVWKLRMIDTTQNGGVWLTGWDLKINTNESSAVGSLGGGRISWNLWHSLCVVDNGGLPWCRGTTDSYFTGSSLNPTLPLNTHHSFVSNTNIGFPVTSFVQGESLTGFVWKVMTDSSGDVRGVGGNTSNILLTGGVSYDTITALSGVSGIQKLYSNGSSIVCGLQFSGDMVCRGEIGPMIGGNNMQSYGPTVLTGLFDGIDPDGVVLSDKKLCVSNNSNDAQCVGASIFDSLSGSNISHISPIVISFSSTVIDLDFFKTKMCALGDDSMVYCTYDHTIAPSVINNVRSGVVALSVGNGNCTFAALHYSGYVLCTTINNDLSTVSLLDGSNIIEVYGDLNSLCVVNEYSEVLCRGHNGGKKLSSFLTNVNEFVPLTDMVYSLTGNSIMNNSRLLLPPVELSSPISGDVGYVLEGTTGIIRDVQTTHPYFLEGSGLTYSLLPYSNFHNDVNKFTINQSGYIMRSGSGSPDYENPMDVGGDNIYNFIIKVQSIDGLIDSVPFSIQVMDKYEGVASPGCVGGSVSLWLRADDNISSPSIWYNSNGLLREYLSASGSTFPSLYANANLVNFNPSYNMDGTRLLTSLGGTAYGWENSVSESSLVYNVVSSNPLIEPQGTLRELFGESRSDRLGLLNTYTGYYEGYDYVNPIQFSAGITTLYTGTDANVWKFKRENNDISLQSFDSLIVSNNQNSSSLDHISVGASFVHGGGWNDYFIGNVPEIIAYSDEGTISSIESSNSDARIQSYLAIKYGLTMSSNYLAGDGSVVYSVSGYNNNIVGIAREECSLLDQKQSQSFGGEGLFSISTQLDTTQSMYLTNKDNPMAMGYDSSYLIAGDNGMPTTWTSINAPTGYVTTQYVAKVQTKNPINIAYLLINGPTSNASKRLLSPLTGSTIYVQYANNPNFTNPTIPLALSSLSGGLLGTSLGSTISGSDTKYMRFLSPKWYVSNNTITAPNTISGTVTTSTVSQTVQMTSDYFSVIDNRGDDMGYYTTLSMSDFVGPDGLTILSTLIDWKRQGTVSKISGQANSLVTSTMLTSFVDVTANPIVFLKRDPAYNLGKKGTYGAKLTLRVPVSPYKSPGTYTGTITYTLYDSS